MEKRVFSISMRAEADSRHRSVVPRTTTSQVTASLPPRDSESQPETIRTTLYVQHLHIRYANATDLADKKYLRVNETFSWTAIGLLCSEGTGIILALVVGSGLKTWFSLWWCAPLFLKILATVFHVRRQPLEQERPKIHRHVYSTPWKRIVGFSWSTRSFGNSFDITAIPYGIRVTL